MFSVPISSGRIAEAVAATGAFALIEEAKEYRFTPADRLRSNAFMRSLKISVREFRNSSIFCLGTFRSQSSAYSQATREEVVCRILAHPPAGLMN